MFIPSSWNKCTAKCWILAVCDRKSPGVNPWVLITELHVPVLGTSHRQSHVYRVCGHCDKTLDAKAYKEHRKRYFHDGTWMRTDFVNTSFGVHSLKHHDTEISEPVQSTSSQFEYVPASKHTISVFQEHQLDKSEKRIPCLVSFTPWAIDYFALYLPQNEQYHHHGTENILRPVCAC